MRSRGLSFTLLLLLAVLPVAADQAIKPADRDGDPGIQRVWAAPGQTADQVLTHRRQGRGADVTAIDPGPAPEGDYIGGIAFLPNGHRVLVTNSITDNVTIFDWLSMIPLINIDVGVYPGGVAATDDNHIESRMFHVKHSLFSETKAGED